MEAYNWFQLRRVQLSYNLPMEIRGFKRLQVYVRGANLLNVSPIQDKVDVRHAASPATRTYALGVNAAF